MQKKKRTCHAMQHRRCSHTVTWNRNGVYRHQKNASLQTPVPERALHGLNHVFGILGRHTTVGTPITTPSSDVHAHRGFVHVVIIHHLATQHPSAGLTLAEDWGRVAPEVAAVACHPAGERIAGPCSSRSFTKPVACGSEEGVDTQKRRPLLETAVTPTRGWRSCQGRVRSLAGGGKTGVLQRSRARGHGRGKGLRAGVGTVDVVTSHVLVRGLVARDLNELNSTQHRNPD